MHGNFLLCIASVSLCSKFVYSPEQLPALCSCCFLAFYFILYIFFAGFLTFLLVFSHSMSSQTRLRCPSTPPKCLRLTQHHVHGEGQTPLQYFGVLGAFLELLNSTRGNLELAPTPQQVLSPCRRPGNRGRDA